MQCRKCGNELSEGALFCPFCGEKVPVDAPVDDTPLYQTEVKGLRRSGQLIVYRDRTEFVLSAVQKMVFPYASLVSVKKGLDRINFIMEDGRTESCTINRKKLHEAFYIIEQASRPYLIDRDRRLRSGGVRYSFPSSRAGLSGMLNSGLLNISGDRCEYCSPSGKDEIVSYEDVKSAQLSAMGALEFSLYDGGKKAFTVDKERRDEIVSFVQESLVPFIEARRERLLAQGIYFSFINNQGFNKGVLNIYADRLEYQNEAGQTDAVPFRGIREVRVYESTLETALTNGTNKSFPIDKDEQREVRAFLEEAIAPFVEERTAGFDIVFGLDERLEINEARGVFHVIRQDGREITNEYGLEDIVRAEALETKTPHIVSALLTSRGDGAAKNSEERITDMGVLLTVRAGQGAGNVPVRFENFAFAVGRANPDYERGAAELKRFFTYMEERLPNCKLTPLAPVVEPSAPAEISAASGAAFSSEGGADAEQPIAQTSTEDGAGEHIELGNASTSGNTDAVSASGAVERSQFGTLIDGVSNFVGQCGTPMTIAIQGDWESGSGSFIRMIYDNLAENGQNNLLWLYTWQFSQFDLGEQLPMLLADKLVELLGGAVNEEAKARAKMLAQGVINIASGLISQGSSDGQKLTDALFKDNLANSLEQKVKLFNDLVKRKVAANGGRVIIFVDDLNRLTPAKVAELLDAMRYFFDCPGCIFIVAVDRETVIAGRSELNGTEYDGEKGDAYFDKIFKTAFRVPKSSFNLQKYIVDNLGRVNISGLDETEVRHYGELAALSVGSEPKALERLFNSFQLLKSLSGEETFSGMAHRLTLFALLCMQSRFPGAYRALVQMQGQITPELLSSLATGSVVEEQAGFDDADRQAFRTFAAALCDAVSTDGVEGVSEEECRAFAHGLAVSAITSSR